MFIKRKQKSKRGFTMIELIIGMGIFGIVSLALMSIYFFSARSFAAMATYAELDKVNRTAMDKMTYEIRQAWQVTSATTDNSGNVVGITLVNGSQQNVSYTFDSVNKHLIRSAGGSSQILLTDCSLIYFHLYQRNPISGSYDHYDASTNDYTRTTKLISVTWKASRPIAGGPAVSENIQTAQVVIRKQDDTH